MSPPCQLAMCNNRNMMNSEQSKTASFYAGHVRADRVRRLQQLFDQWTEEDGKLSDEEAGRLRTALDESRGLRFGTSTLD
jgi:hypothetical protein